MRIERIEGAYRALEQQDATPLLEIVAPEAEWIVDWKGEGVFGGGPLFGRRRFDGRQGAGAFFDELFGQLRVESFTARDYVTQGDEIVVLGKARWQRRADGGSYASDFTMRWIFENGHASSGRLLTLPDGHIETFIEDEESYERYTSPEAIRDVVRKYQKLYFDAYLFGKTWGETYWLGHHIFKCPLDLWVYQELLFKQRPDFVIETGTNYGGSALYLANMCDLVGHGEVISIDITDHYAGGKRPEHPRITYLLGSSTSTKVMDAIRERMPEGATCLVILDSDHRMDHVLDELRLYHPLVNVGSYLIVEDTNLNGNPVKQNYGPGPSEAIDAFLEENDDFRVDPEMEKFFMTFNPGGFLRRVR